MKFVIVSSWILVGSFVEAGVFAASLANQYKCVGDATSATVYFGPGGAAPSFQVVNLGLGVPGTTEETLELTTFSHSAMGRVVSGTFTNIADARLTFTLIIPDVGIKDDDVIDVKAMLVRSLEPTLPLPSGAVLTGPRQNNDFRPVTCVASIVR